MKRIIKALFWLIGGALVLLLVTVIVVPLLIDPNDYKQQITSTVERYTGRQLVLNGDLSLSIFPWLGIEAGPLSLSNPPGFAGESMLSVASVRVRLKLMPLLRKEYQLDTIELDEPVIRLRIDPKGRSNWEDLAPESKKNEDDETNTLAKIAGVLAINGLIVNRGSVYWQDEYEKSRYEITDLYIETGKVLNMTPVEVKVRGKVKGESLEQTRLALHSVVLLDAKSKSLLLTDTQLTVSLLDISSAVQIKEVKAGHFGESITINDISSTLGYAGESYSIAIDSMNLQPTGQTAKIENIRISGKYNDVDLAAQFSDSIIDLEGQKLLIPTFSVRADDAKITGLLSAQQLMASPRLQGRIQTNQFDLRALLRRFKFDWGASDSNALRKVQLVSDFELSTDELLLKQFQGSVDDTTATGFVSVSGFAHPKYQFDVRLSDLDVDRYLPVATPEKESVEAPGALIMAVPAMLFREQDANGVVSINSLRVSGFSIEKVLVGVSTLGRVVTIRPMSAELYGGKLRGNIQMDASGPKSRISVEQELTGVRIGSVLNAAKITDRVDGAGDLSLSATIEQQDGGQTVQGETQFALQQGTVKGVNIRKLMLQARDIYNRVKQREQVPHTDDPEQEQFQFTEMKGSVQFDQQKAINRDLKVKSPLLRALGSGEADLLHRKLDYNVEVHVVESVRGQGGEELAELRGIPIPLNISGTFQKPQYRLNVDRLLQLVLQKQIQKEQRKLQQKIEDKIQNKLEKLLQ